MSESKVRELVERLRRAEECNDNRDESDLFLEAADAIERLLREDEIKANVNKVLLEQVERLTQERDAER